MAKKHKASAPAADPAMGNEVVERKPVKERGSDLLTRIYNEGGMYLTKDEAEGIIASGDAHVNLDDTQGNTALVMLTEQGAALVAPSTKGKTEKMTYEIESNIPIPDRKRGRKGTPSKYPFDALEVGQSFHVPASDTVKDPVSALASSLTGARRRFSEDAKDSEGNIISETVTRKVYQTDDKGKRVKVDGHYVVTGTVEGVNTKHNQLRDFTVVRVDATDPKGPGARVFRVR